MDGASLKSWLGLATGYINAEAAHLSRERRHPGQPQHAAEAAPALAPKRRPKALSALGP